MQEGWQSPEDAQLDVIRALYRGLDGLMRADFYAVDDENVLFKGELLDEPDEVYEAVKARFEALGYTPQLTEREGETVIIAQEGVMVARSINARWWVHLILFVVTFITTLIIGAEFSGFNPNVVLVQTFERGHPEVMLEALKAGAPFALTLLGILGVHEMGHYLAARYHGVETTLPFFIPLPLRGSLGTLGAVIMLKGSVDNRRKLFDVGAAGPLAGLTLAVPLFLIGLNMARPTGFNTALILAGVRGVGVPPLLDFLGSLALPGANLSREIFFRPVAMGAWLGILVTSFNLLPIAQFDGGHIAYALLGKKSRPLMLAVFAGLIVLGLTTWGAWLIWALMALLSGVLHPVPGDDLTQLDRPRLALGVVMFAIFALVFMPVPFVFR
jgi:membrane-associated protease RseP (regulator of RpoE activity)